ncbi:MAG: hypothetical protein JW797_12395 [Bradymonadales bacterium]|nr:hypothetical protein [Bradymonadales bacterium]
MSPRAFLLAPDQPILRRLVIAIRSAAFDLELATQPEQLSTAMRSNFDVVLVACPDLTSSDPFYRAYLTLADFAGCTRLVLVGDLQDARIAQDLIERSLLRHIIPLSRPGLALRILLALAIARQCEATGPGHGLPLPEAIQRRVPRERDRRKAEQAGQDHSLSSSPVREEREVIFRGQGEDALASLERFFPYGSVLQERTLQDSRQKEEALAALARYAEGFTSSKRLIQAACGTADELLTNAFYDAPVDAAGRPLFRSLPRNRPVRLPFPSRISFQYGCDGHALWLSVRDPFGSLDRGTFYRHLLVHSRSDRERSPEGRGDGIGLSTLFWTLSDLFVHLVPSVGTEIIGSLSIQGSYREHLDQPRSFHFFEHPIQVRQQ